MTLPYVGLPGLCLLRKLLGEGAETMALPPGQFALDHFPRFGLNQFARRFPTETKRIAVTVTGGTEPFIVTGDDLAALPRIEQTSDFHCVTTWSRLGLTWGGFRFRDFHEQFIAPRLPDLDGVVFLRCQDGFRARLPLEYLLANDVLLADRLNGEPLSVEHGAPLRLIAPAHYGYKNAKHLDRLEFGADPASFRGSSLKFMEHHRALTALEERGSGISGKVLRYLYRPLIKPTIRKFKRAMEER